MIVFLVLFLLAAGACILLFFKLRDMMSGDVDLARERSAQRKVNRNADAVTIRRSDASRSSRERSDAYPAGERSGERLEAGKHRQTCHAQQQVDENAHRSPFSPKNPQGQQHGEGLQGEGQRRYGDADPGADRCEGP